MSLSTRHSLVRIALAAMSSAYGIGALAVEQPVEFGAPTVLSQQGQRLKVVLPVRSAPDDERATAASFLVRETEVEPRYGSVPPEGFTVMRPARADYMVLQSGGVVNAPRISVLMSVAGDPRSPYRMDLDVPPANASNQLAMSGARGVGRWTGSEQAGVATRKLRGPVGDPTLPPK
jgi:hypothetical protein